jgi:hypothetical protein
MASLEELFELHHALEEEILAMLEGLCEEGGISFETVLRNAQSQIAQDSQFLQPRKLFSDEKSKSVGETRSGTPPRQEQLQLQSRKKP